MLRPDKFSIYMYTHPVPKYSTKYITTRFVPSLLPTSQLKFTFADIIVGICTEAPRVSVTTSGSERRLIRFMRRKVTILFIE